MNEKFAVQIDLTESTFVSGGLAGDGRALPYFGFLHIGRLSIYLAGRNAEVAESARDLARRISTELERVAAESEKRQEELAATTPIDVSGEPIPDRISADEVWF